MTIKEIFDDINRAPFFTQTTPKVEVAPEYQLSTADIHDLHNYQHRLETKEAWTNLLSSELGCIGLFLILMTPIVILGM